MSMLPLVADAEVQKAIGVTDEQKEYLTALRDQIREENNEFQKSIESLPGEERFAKMRERAEKRSSEIEGDIQEILGEGPFQRLKQIRLQMMGVMEWMNPNTAREIGLTEEQQNQFRESIREQFASMRGIGREEMRGRLSELRQGLEEKGLALLTEKQKERWQGMLGEPAAIDFERLQRSLRPEGGRGPRGGRGPDDRGPDGRRGRSRSENNPSEETPPPADQ
jgi:hypothetical protein